MKRLIIRSRDDLIAAQATGVAMRWLFFWGHTPQPMVPWGSTC